MRPILLYMLAAAGVADKPQPILTVDRVSGMLLDTLHLGINALVFTSMKLEDSLTAFQPTYSKFRVHSTQYATMVAEAYSTSPTVGLLRDCFGAVAQVVFSNWKVMEARVNPGLDKVVEDFESHFPTSKGLIGETLLDRILLGLWLYWLVAKAMRAVCKRRRRFARKYL